MINYYLLTKPGIVLGNLFPFTAGFLLASKGSFDISIFLATLIGLSLVMAAACVFNNYIDRNLDKKMQRTKDRPLAKGIIPKKNALYFGTLLGFLGGLVLLFYTNALTVGITAFGFFIYVVVYSLWKSHTIYSTAVGSIAGAVPPVVGYCAVSNQFDMGAFILFMMMVLWQMPHFFAIAITYFDDYKAAHVPVLPIERGLLKTKVHMFIYISSFMLAASMLTLFHYTGLTYLFIALSLSAVWLYLSWQGFKQTDSGLWARRMFHFSLVVIFAICFAIPLDIANPI